MRLVAAAVVSSILFSVLLCPFCWASNDKVIDAETVAALETKAATAHPEDRCFLYAKLVSEMTELAGRQLNAGEPGKASATLMRVQQYAEKIHSELASKSKKLKNAELLMEQTCFRMKSILGAASYEERPPVEATLKQLDQVQSELMMQVFRQ
jgi:hypothetical protein